MEAMGIFLFRDTGEITTEIPENSETNFRTGRTGRQDSDSPGCQLPGESLGHSCWAQRGGPLKERTPRICVSGQVGASTVWLVRSSSVLRLQRPHRLLLCLCRLLRSLLLRSRDLGGEAERALRDWRLCL